MVDNFIRRKDSFNIVDVNVDMSRIINVLIVGIGVVLFDFD